MSMQGYVWMEIGKMGKLRSTTLVHLEKETNLIYWNGSNQACGTWDYVYGYPTASGSLIMEFSANPKTHVPRKRHMLRQLDDTDFVLLEKDHPVYSSARDTWTNGSVTHSNNRKIIAKKINTDKYMTSP